MRIHVGCHNNFEPFELTLSKLYCNLMCLFRCDFLVRGERLVKMVIAPAIGFAIEFLRNHHVRVRGFRHTSDSCHKFSSILECFGILFYVFEYRPK